MEPTADQVREVAQKILTREGEVRSFAHRMRIQRRVFQIVALAFGAAVTPDRASSWGKSFADVVPPLDK